VVKALAAVARSVLVSALAVLSSVPAAAADLVVEVVDLRSDGGEVRVGLFDVPATFATDDGKIGELILKPEGRTARGVFSNLAPRVYAMASYHDENGNRSFDRGFLGWPLEGFAFSNGATTTIFGPLPFERAAVTVPANGTVAVIRMVYW